jgi:hypothetical protein
MTTTTPCAGATSDMRAREEIKKVLCHFGCEEIGLSDNYEQHEVLLYFRHRGRQVQLRASAKGWTQAWPKEESSSGNTNSDSSLRRLRSLRSLRSLCNL